MRASMLAGLALAWHPGLDAGAETTAPAAARTVRARIQTTPYRGWEEGVLVALTDDTLVIRCDGRFRNDTLALRDLQRAEVSLKTRTSGVRTVGGLLGGAALGGLAGGCLALVSGGWALIQAPLMGACVGAFVGLIVGQNPAPAWKVLYVPAGPDSAEAGGLGGSPSGGPELEEPRR